uniref:Transmembrane protein 14A n=1 Tax=Castor canadensis TaxID=51338 RepID=A0A8C0ZUT8_CASCN
LQCPSKKTLEGGGTNSSHFGIHFVSPFIFPPGGVPSLIAGLFFGFLAGYGAYRVSNDKRDVKLSLFTAFFLATIMGVRFKRSKKIMPAGLVAGLSFMMVLRLVLLLL